MVICPHCKKEIESVKIEMELGGKPRYKEWWNKQCPHCNMSYQIYRGMRFLFNVTKTHRY